MASTMVAQGKHSLPLAAIRASTDCVCYSLPCLSLLSELDRPSPGAFKELFPWQGWQGGKESKVLLQAQHCLTLSTVLSPTQHAGHLPRLLVDLKDAWEDTSSGVKKPGEGFWEPLLQVFGLGSFQPEVLSQAHSLSNNMWLVNNRSPPGK